MIDIARALDCRSANQSRRRKLPLRALQCAIMRLLSALFVAFLVLTVVSHPRADEGSAEDESSGFRELDDGLLLRGGVGTGNQTISFGVQDADLSHHEITVAPNASLYVILGLQYRRIGQATSRHNGG